MTLVADLVAALTECERVINAHLAMPNGTLAGSDGMRALNIAHTALGQVMDTKVRFSDLQDRAWQVVNADIGDKFYEPETLFGEFDLPENIAINAIAHALATQALEFGMVVVMDAEDLPEIDTEAEAEAEETDEEEADAAAAYAMG